MYECHPVDLVMVYCAGKIGHTPSVSQMSLWRNRPARSAVNWKVGGSNPPRDGAAPPSWNSLALFKLHFNLCLWWSVEYRRRVQAGINMSLFKSLGGLEVVRTVIVNISLSVQWQGESQVMMGLNPGRTLLLCVMNVMNWVTGWSWYFSTLDSSMFTVFVWQYFVSLAHWIQNFTFHIVWIFWNVSMKKVAPL